MRIAVDASRTTLARRTGTEAYALHLTRALLAAQSDHDWLLYFRDDPASDLLPAGPQVATRVIRRQRLWTHLGLGPALRRDQPDGVFIPAHVMPLFSPVPAVVTVHDLGYLRFPEAHTANQRRYLDWSTRYAVRHARHLLADSEATASDLQHYYGAQAGQMTVVYPGGDERLRPVRHPAQRGPVMAKYGIAGPYILYVGTLQPRKNLVRLVNAFAPLADRATLVLAGKPGWLSAPIEAHIAGSGLGERVRQLGYVPDDDLPTLYSAATVFAMPSLFEGFGFPVLEAMRCGTPVVSSRGGSLPEVGGEAALYVDATDTAGWTTALAQTLDDEALRQRMIIAGFQQASRFRWATAAAQVLQVFERAFAT